jgi:SNF2 family DNA or RNA helicase
VEGADAPEGKLDALDRFTRGDARVIVTKTSIFGQGLNLQMCGRQVFCGLSDSFDAYHQALRRSWRFGRRDPVHAYIVLTEPEEAIYANVLRKEQQFEQMTDELVRHVAEFERAEIISAGRSSSLPHDQPMRLPAWLGVSA